MALWEQSNEPGEKPATMLRTDKHVKDGRPADGTQSGITNRTDARSVATRIVQKGAKMLWVRGDGSIAATFSIIPELDTSTPILIIANTGYDAYVDVAGIPRPKL